MAISFSSPHNKREASFLEHMESGFKRKKRSMLGMLGILGQRSFTHRDEEHGRTSSNSVDDILQREALMGSSVRELTQSEINAVRSGSKVSERNSHRFSRTVNPDSYFSISLGCLYCLVVCCCILEYCYVCLSCDGAAKPIYIRVPKLCSRDS